MKNMTESVDVTGMETQIKYKYKNHNILISKIIVK